MTSLRCTLRPPDPTLFPLDTEEAQHPLQFATRKAKGAVTAVRDRRDVFNNRLLEGLTLVGPYDIPKIEACTHVPAGLISFSEAMGTKKPDPRFWVHFYEDDYKFTRLWNQPKRYYDRLKLFGGIITPDFSLYRNMPVAQKIEHTYKNQLLGARLQADGFNVVTNVRLSGRASIPYALAGVPVRSTVAIGLHGCTKSRENRPHVVEEIKIICDHCRPANLVVFGSGRSRILDYPRELGIRVHVYAPDTYRRSPMREVA